jgi:transposase
MADRRAYPSDLPDARWELIEPGLSAWRFERRGRALDFGRPPEHDLREIMNAILYVDRTGVRWRYLPHDFPHWNPVYGYFAKWQSDGIFAQLNGLLRELVRQQEGRNAKPSACVIDAQSVKTSTSVPAASQGTDNAKKIVGRKRSIVTDTLGLLLAVLVTAAGVQDMDITTRTPGTRVFTPIPKRWAVERTYGWLMLHRRLARDYATHPHRSEAMIHLAMTDLMTRRLTGENTISWRDPA